MQEKIREDVRTILIPRVKARLERAGDKLAGLIGAAMPGREPDTLIARTLRAMQESAATA